MALLFQKLRSLWPDLHKEPKPPVETLPAPLSILWHGLPQELRDEIWIHVFTLDDRVRVISRGGPIKAVRDAVALLRTCKAVYHRNHPIFWSRNVFGMGCRLRGESPLAWSPPPRSREHIRTLWMDIAELAEVLQMLVAFPLLRHVYVEHQCDRSRNIAASKVSGMATVLQAARRNPGVEFVVVTGALAYRNPEPTEYVSVAADHNSESVVREVTGFEDERALPWWARQ